jgi:hypothetical protein
LPQILPTKVFSQGEPEIRIEYLDNFEYDNDDDDNDHHHHADHNDDDGGNNNRPDHSEHVSTQLCEQYNRTHGLRRHTIARPDLLIHGQTMPTLTSKVRFTHKLSSIEPTLLTHRLTNLQQQQQQQCQTNVISSSTRDYHNNVHNDDDDEDYESVSTSSPYMSHSRHTHSNSYNGLCVPSLVTTIPSTANEYQQRDSCWLSPPISNSYRRLF